MANRIPNRLTESYQKYIWDWAWEMLKINKLQEIDNRFNTRFEDWDPYQRHKLTQEQGTSDYIPVYTYMLKELVGELDQEFTYLNDAITIILDQIPDGGIISPTGFERWNGDVGTGGWRLIGRPEANYDTPTGAWTVDGSYATGDPDYTGAIGGSSTAWGYDVEAQGWGSHASGYHAKVWSTATTGFAHGSDIDLSGYSSAAFGYNIHAGLQIGQQATWTGYLQTPEVVTGTADTYADYGFIAGRNHIVTTDFAFVAGSNNYVLDDVLGLGYLSVMGSNNRVSARYSSVIGFVNFVEAEGGFVSGQNIHIEQILANTCLKAISTLLLPF